jgi:hypothetical protein
VLDKLIDATRERLVLEVAALGGHDRRKVGVSLVSQFFLSRAPVMFVSQNGTSGKRSVQKFFITSSALENLLFHHRRMFARVDTTPSEHKNRYISIAHRQRVKELVVVTGPTSSGKSTLISQLTRGEQPRLAEALGIEDPSRWPSAGSKEIKQLGEPELDGLVFHYDFLRPYLRSAKTHDRDEALHLLDTAERVTFVTIWRPPEALRDQLQRGEIEPRTKFGRYRGSKRHRLLAAEYEDPAQICAHYRRWFEFTQRRSDRHLVASFEDPAASEPEILTIEQWEALVRPLQATNG